MTSATLETLKAATDHFGAVLGRVEPDQYELATPCTEWSVVQLVDHVVVGARWAGMILRGADGRAALAQILSTPLSDDRRVDWLAAGAEQLAAFADPGALERTVAHPIGPTPARAFLHLRVGDLVVHAWDLAHAVGGDERLPSDLVAAALLGFEARAGELAATGVFGAGPAAGERSTDPQQRLLQITGRLR